MPVGGPGPVITEQPAGEVEGSPVYRYVLANGAGMKVEIFNYGGIVRSVEFPDRSGRPANIVLGFRTLPEYVKYNPAPSPVNTDGAGVYFGALIGRFANRIAGGQFAIDGACIRVPTNDGPNALHGGHVGFDQRVWRPTVVRGDDAVSLRLEYLSPAGEMGFPGALSTVATYALDNDNRLTLRFEATTDATTVLNLTNHTYWNLGGEPVGSVYDHLLYINADAYLPMGPSLVPTGRPIAVAGTAFDFREPKTIGEGARDEDPQLVYGHGYDHNWVLRQATPGELTLAATVVDPKSGRGLNVHTTQPGLQFYSGNFLDATLVGSGGHIYRQGDGFALETQHFPDAPNHPAFPSTELRAGDMYQETTIFELFCEPG
jgi:aldose 1-epimerase